MVLLTVEFDDTFLETFFVTLACTWALVDTFDFLVRLALLDLLAV